MFERFSERARQVVVLAQEEARSLNHNYIGTEHVLLGLLREKEGLAARVLESLDITAERVRAQVVGIVGSGEDVTRGQIPFTPRAKEVLERALREAQSLGRANVDTEHFLLGLVDENEGVAARILLDFGVQPDEIRNHVIRGLAGRTAKSLGPEVGVAEPSYGWSVDQPFAAASDLELGWRGRPIALAALGAAVLARAAFDRSKTGYLEPLEMQLLARLTLGSPDLVPADPGELFESIVVTLACDRDDLRDAVRVLAEQQLVHRQEKGGELRISVTIAGCAAVRRWLEQAAPLFGTWPPDHPAADDAIG
ncbi:MAG TPA: Clp protease N-terminal domain-containing protein [Solirubrobacteraceae bacterium]|nr:Clp protease N-terminal domain-containing protein [Solirubrobacteraceae bacterium]